MFANEKAVSLRDDICPPGRRSAAAVRVSHASATTHPESSIARQRASRRPAMVYPHPVADAPFPPIMGKRSSPLCTAVRRRASGRTGLPAQPCTSHQHKEGLVPATAAPCAAVTSTLSPSVPQGKVNARAASVLRTTVCAGNPLHNITQHCVTSRRERRLFPLRTQRDVMLSISVCSS